LKTKQKRELVGKTERTTTDKLRERRLKKRRQKSQRLQKEKREKLKAEKTARLGSMKNLLDSVTTSRQEGKNKNKSRQTVSLWEISVFYFHQAVNLIAASVCLSVSPSARKIVR